MAKHSITVWLAQYPWLAIGLVVVILVILLLPYDIDRLTRTSGIYHRWRSSLWIWTSGPRRRRLYLNGLWRAQAVLLALAGQLWRRMQGWLITWLWECIRRRLG